MITWCKAEVAKNTYFVFVFRAVSELFAVKGNQSCNSCGKWTDPLTKPPSAMVFVKGLSSELLSLGLRKLPCKTISYIWYLPHFLLTRNIRRPPVSIEKQVETCEAMLDRSVKCFKVCHTSLSTIALSISLRPTWSIQQDPQQQTCAQHPVAFTQSFHTLWLLVLTAYG